ncbi:hypothetical protein KAR91_00215 [Candidatus Pacearchaeota archaeon]|nr:hypothetical protein [Candidatus Pacearchaeota archaeon]
MKRIILMLTIAILAIASQAQPYTVLDSTITQDRKVKGAIEIKTKTWDLLNELVSEEKASTDTVINLPQTRQLYNVIANAVDLYALEFLVVDTIIVTDSVYQVWLVEYTGILDWIQAVENDPDIQGVTNISTYKKKVARRNKLLGFNRQILSQQ